MKRDDSANAQANTNTNSYKQHSLLAIGLYSLLSLLLTWPLATRFATHVPGNGIDDPSLAWNLWWIKARLVEQLNFDIFHADWTFFPIQINLAFYTLTPLNGLLSIPLQSAFSLVIASNLILLSSYVLGGLGTYLLARQELREWLRSTDWANHTVNHTVNHSGGYLKENLSTMLTVPALFAGLVYAFASSKLFYASLGQFNIASSQWVPFCVLFVLRIGRCGEQSPDRPATRPATPPVIRRRQLRNALLAGIFFVFQTWAELTYATFLIIFIGVWLLWQLWHRLQLGSKLRSHQKVQPSPETLALVQQPSLFSILTALFGMGIVAAIGLIPFLAAMIPDMRAEGDFFTSGGGFADIFSADLLGYLLPTQLHPLLGPWVRTLPFSHDKGQQIFVGYSVMLLAGIAIFAALRKLKQPRAVYFWLLNSLLFFLLTLGPHLRWMGKDSPIPGPFELISRLPFFNGNRYPSRYSIMLMLSLAILSAMGIVLLRRMLVLRTQRTKYYRPVVAIFTFLFLFEHLSIPLPVSDFHVPSIYERIAQTPGDFTVLELPTGWRNGAREIGRPDAIFMMQQWYQTTHGKRRLAGNTSRNPDYKFQYFSEAPFISDLIALMNADQWFVSGEVDGQWQRMVDEARRDAPQVLNFLGVRYLTVNVERSTAQLLRFVDEALPVTLVDSWQGNDWTGAPSTIQLYEVNVSIPFGEVDLRSKMGRLYQAEGWSSLAGVGAVVRPTATLLLNLPDATAGRLEIELGEHTGSLELWLNGKFLTTLEMSTGADASEAPSGEKMQTYPVEIPAGWADQLVDRLELRFRNVDASRQIAAAQTEWQLGGTNYHVPIAVRSAGADVGGFGQIFVAGEQVAINERGYNLVAISEQGTVLERVVFDTFGNCPVEPPDESAGQALANWLAKWQPGTIIAGAASDESSCRLSQGAVDALHKIGVNGDLRNHFRWSHAFIGAVGEPGKAMQPGEAIESMTLLQPAQVSVGGRMDSPLVYALIGKIGYLPSDPSAAISTP